MPPSRSPRLLLLVRHGETEWSAQRRHTGTSDIGLTEAGEVEAAAAGGLLVQRLGFEEPTVVYTSPRRRARRTAELTLGEPGRAAVVSDLIAEFDYGRYEGRTGASIGEENPGWDLWRDGCPDGEQPDEVMDRANRFVRLVREEAAGGVVVAFTHGHMSRALVAAVLGQGAGFASLLHNDTASIAELRDRDGRMALTGWNLRPHGAVIGR